MANLFDSFGELLSNSFSSSKEEPMQSRQDYMKDALYFKKGSEINDPRPGNKINRSQVDSIVYAANLGVTTGLMDRDMGDRFIANQFQELRNDFAVNAKDKKGETIKLPVTPGATNRAADTLYGLKSGDGVTFYEPDRAAGKGREFSSEGKRYRTVDPNSPYNENIPPEQLQSNAKIALLTWLSKKGKDVDETTMNWNGDQRYGAKEHLAKVKRREEDLAADYNKDIRDYIVERVAYDSKYKGKPSSLEDQAVKSKEEGKSSINIREKSVKFEADEKEFQEGIRKTEWFKEFKKEYGEEPNLNDKDYDYRAAWKAGIRPERDPYDKNRYHWSSSLPDGTMLKSKNHPTAWKEDYMRATGKNPDEVKATKADWEKMQSKSKK